MHLEKMIGTAFDAGFSNAARSLGQLSKYRVFYNNFHSGNCRLDTTYLVHDAYQRYNEGSRVLLTTEIIGDLTGKSYLFFSPYEFDLLTEGIPQGSDSSVNLKEEFLKEMDNILSAAVITKISNELKGRIFGDVPVLVGKTQSRLEDIINDDFSEHTEELYINSIFFSFEKQPAIQPLFLWVINHSNVEAGALKLA